MENPNLVVGGFTPENKEKLVQAMKIMHPYSFCKKFGELSYHDLLKHLAIFNNIMQEVMLDLCAREEIGEIALSTAETILDHAKGFNPEELVKIRQHENRVKIYQVVKSKFPEIFKKVEHEYSQILESNEFSRELKIIKRDIEKGTSALISTEEEAKEWKKKICVILDEFASKVRCSILDELRRSQILENIEQVKASCMEFVDKKLKEEPVRLYYYRTGNNRVAVKLKWDRNSYTYKVGMGKGIRHNKENDKDEYPLIVSTRFIMDFLFLNDIREVDTWIDPRSVDTFYVFCDQVSVTLNKPFVDKWWGYDCPALYRCTVNKNRDVNMIGEPISHFETQLIESTCYGDYVDNSITEEEFRALTKGREHTRIYKAILNALEAKELVKDEAKVAEIRSVVEAFDARVQGVIDAHREEIFNYLKNEFRDRLVPLSEEEKKNRGIDFRIDDNFGFDCGFLDVMANDEDYSKKRMLLHQIVPSESRCMSVRFPYLSQSTTLNEVQFRKIKEIVRRETGIDLYAHVILD